MKSKLSALQEISSIAQENNLENREIYEHLEKSGDLPNEHLISSISSYIGAVFLLGGISAYISVFWTDMQSISKILFTLGIGIIFHLFSLWFEVKKKHPKIIIPLYILSFILQVVGVFILWNEYISVNNNWQEPILFTFGVVIIPQLLSFFWFGHTVFLFNAIVCATFALMAIFSLFNLNFFIIGMGLIALSYILNKKKYHITSSFWYFVGGIIFLVPMFFFLRKHSMEPYFILPSCFLVYLSTITRSRALLIISILSLFCFLSYFTGRYFATSMGWPVSLIAIGCILLLLSNVAYKINKKI